MASTYVPQRFEKLHRLISDGLSDDTAGSFASAAASTSQAGNWIVAIDAARQDIANLGQAKPPNDAERREIEGGSITIDGTTANLQRDFAQQTLQLAQFLSVSERYAASLLQVGMAGRARWGRTAIEVACLLYYREKLALLACLKDLLSALLAARSEELTHPTLVHQAETFLAKLVSTDVPIVSPPGNKISFTKRILNEIESTVEQAGKLEQQLRLGGNQPASQFFSDEVILESVEFVKQQTRDLGHVLYLFAANSLLRAQDVQQISEWLKSVPPAKFSTHTIYVLVALLASLDAASPLLLDSTFIKGTTTALEASWQTEPIRCAIALQWSLCMVRLLKNAASGSELRAQEEKIQALVTGAIRGRVFAFLNLNVLEFRHKQLEDEVWNAVDDYEEKEKEKAESNKSDIDPVFQEYILLQLQRMISGVSSVMLPVLRKIQREEEDAVFATSRGRADASKPRHEIMQLFDLVATICHGRAEAGLEFWVGQDGRMTRFLLWAVDVREAGHQRSLLNMLASMATGAECAHHAHTLLSNGEGMGGRFVSWDRLFEWLQYYLDLFAKNPSARKIPDEEETLLLAFVRLLRNVVFYSTAARASLYENTPYAALRRIFNMSISQVDLRLKAALLDTLAAFAKPDGAGSERVQNDIWSLMSTTDLLGTGKGTIYGQGGTTGALYALEHTETAERNYVSTCSLINFLSVILPSRVGGVDDYVKFVVETVFMQAATREYNRLSDRWKVTSSCLGFFQRCLESFRLEDLLEGKKIESQLALQPGFLIMKYLLTGSPMAKEVFTILNTGFETLNTARTALLTTCIKEAMRCVRRTFKLQDLFLQVLLPGLLESTHDTSRIGTPARYAPLDQHLLHSHQTVVEIALYINSTSDAVALLSTEILSQIASSQSFAAVDRFSIAGGKKQMSRLVGLLEMSEETARVRSGYIERLQNPEMLEPEDEDEDGSGGPPTSLRLAILDLLISHVSNNPPSISHLLLGYDVTGESQVIPDPDSPSASPGVFHAILALLNTEDNSFQTLLAHYPVLAERCFYLLLRLCTETYSSSATMRYLRTREDFFVTRLIAIPFAPISRGEAQGAAVFPNGLSVPTTIGAAASSLKLKAYMLEMISQEIHALSNADMLNLAAPIIDLLFDAEDDVGVRLLELISSFDFEWHDGRDDVGQTLSLLGDLNIELAKRPDAAIGPREFDLAKGAELLSSARIELQRRGSLQDPAQRQLFETEAGVILRYLAARNAHRAVSVARREALRSWKHVLDIILSRCGSLLRSEDRLSVMFDLLATLLPRIVSGTDVAVIELLSGSVLALITSLRARPEEHYDTLPADRLIATLRSLIGAILQPGTSAMARGNLYSAMINFLHLITAQDNRNGDFSDGLSDNASISGMSVSHSVLQASSSVALRSKGLLLEKSEKLVTVIARDALDAADIWKTVSFTLLERLESLEHSRSKPSRILSMLTKHGYLKSMVAALRDLDMPLQETLWPDPPSLNALYVYEALMSFMVRLASSKAGADALLDARILEALAQADFLATSPEQSAGSLGSESFLPAARERHASLMAPSLELCAAIFSNASAASRPLISLLLAHQDGLANVLKASLQDVALLSQIDQVQLLVTVLGLKAESSENGSLAEVSSFHTHVLAVAASYLTRDGWKARVVPSSDGEREESVRIVRENQTKFELRAEEVVERLQKSLLAYLQASSQGTHLTRPIFTPSLSAPQFGNDAQSAQLRSISVPSLGTAMAALEEKFEKVIAMISRFEIVSAALRNPESTSLDDWEELLRSETDVWDAQAAEVARQPTSRIKLLSLSKREHRAALGQTLDVIELLLVLIYRHLEYYSAVSGVGQQRDGVFRPRTTRAISGSANYDRDMLIRMGIDKSSFFYDRISELSLTESHISGAQERQAFIEMVLRKLSSVLMERSRDG